MIDVTEGCEPSSVAAIHTYDQSTLQRLWKLVPNDNAELRNDIPTLHRQLQALRDEVEQLRKADLPGEGTELWPTLHAVSCPNTKARTVYLDRPSYIWEKQHDHLHGQRIVQPTSWERRHPEKPFVVYVDYHCVASKVQHDDNATTIYSGSHESPVMSTHEAVHITSTALLETLKEFFNMSSILKAYWTGGVIDQKQSLHRPYHFFCHVSDRLRAFSNSLEDRDRQVELEILIGYLSAQSALKEPEIANSIARRQITLSNLPFLFAPGVLLVTEHDRIHHVVCQRSIIQVQVKAHEKKAWLASGPDTVDISCYMDVSEVQFDGRFWAAPKILQIRLSMAKHQPIAFDELGPLPLFLYPTELRDSLVLRGRKFFSCRSGLYVTCDANAKEAGMGSCTRYMVDADVYRRTHEREQSAEQAKATSDGAEELHPDDEPAEDFLLQLPPHIQAFDIQAKSWDHILASDIEPVVWDKAAFRNLAIQPDTKELIEALVRNKIKSDQSIDFVKGKGTGLVVLLHGGPGTGKTLTAETVAEIAEKPLYRVTCGAMGTTATEVEKNLGSVFHLGRRWGCVVLLDEADVFLEQRQLSDLTRNALVSVFLRVIEYFDGIMILTSNRVATFDEAFKSRIQLALHYQALDENQRRQVWQNFIRNLESVDEPIAIEDIKSHIADLSKYEMNGREIRNIINTARQLARFKGEPLDFEHLRHVEQTSGRFNTYVRNVKDGMSDEQWARELSLR